MTSREETNSAIGSWSGFIYQGLCGLLVALRMIKDYPDGVKGYSLQLDAYEDFSIFDENGKIYSLHQCKCIKGKTNYNDEFDKIAEKIEANKGKLQDPGNPRYYFHCNNKVDIDEKYDITAYSFEEGKTYCEPGDILELLNKEVEQLKTGSSNTDAVRASLESLVNANVLNTQQKYFDAKLGERLWRISRNENIPFSAITDKLAVFMASYAPGDFILQMKSEYIRQMDELAAEDENEENRCKTDAFINRLNSLTDVEFRGFIQRINPKTKIEDSQRSWKDVTSTERVNYLYNLITEFPLEMNTMDWQMRTTHQTPSTLGNDEKVEKISRRIYENQANLDLPWLYDWIVGHQQEHVDNIEDAANIITKSPYGDDEGKNIFHTKKVGILTVDEKRSREYD